MKILKYALSITLVLASSANAATENPWYVGARIGTAHYNDFSSNNSMLNIEDNNNFAGGVFLGYNFLPWFSLETGYTDLAELDLGAAGLIDQQGLDIVGKFTWEANDSIEIFAKAGGFYYMTEGSDILNDYDDNGFTATAGLGAEYFFTKQVSARIEYQYYHNLTLQDQSMDSEWNTHFYGLSIVYSWGGSKPVSVIKKQVITQPQVITEQKPIVQAKPTVKPEPIKVKPAIEIAPLTVELPFITNSDNLAQKYLDQLAPIAQHLIDYPRAKLFIVGHTDSRGSEAYNQKLSEQRATFIGKHLEEKFNISKDRMEIIGRGELQPRASNATAKGRAMNRHVSVFTPGLKVSAK